jgi:uncharacterized membrane protein
MPRAIYVYLLTVPVFFGIDLVWLGAVANGFYRDNLGPLLRPTFNWTVGLIFYLLFIVGILVFAVYPAVDRESAVRALWLGALFGFFAYSVYDLTNLATIRDWPLKVSLLDLAWGTVLTAVVSFISYFIARWVG